MLGELKHGRGSVLMLEGPAGIGKTEVLRLAPAMASELQLIPLQAKGGELERDFPYGVVRQLLEPPLARTEPAEQKRLLTGAAGRARIVLRRERRTAEREGSPQEGLDAVLHGLYWLTVNLSEQAPLLLVVDDVHWADSSSQDFLAYLAHRLEDLPIALLLARRTGEGEPSDQLRHIGSRSRVLELPPLSEQAVGELAGRLGDNVSHEFASACAEVTAGNPYLTRELLSALADDGVRPNADAADRVRGFAPRTVARSVLTRVASVSPAAERLARAVALLGRDAELRHGARLAGLDEAEAAVAADALVAASILVPGRPLDFVHPLVRSAIYADLPPAQKGIDHRRAAELLAAEGAEPEHLATHLLAAEPAADQWVVEQLRAAAARVLAEGAPEAAVRYLLRARAEPPPEGERGAVLLQLGAAQASLNAPEAADTLRSAVEQAPDEAGKASAARVLARTVHMQGESLAAVLALEEAIEGLDRDSTDLRMRLEADLLLVTQSAMDARQHLAQRLADARDGATGRTGATAPVVQAVVAVDLAHTDGEAGAAADLAERVLAGGTLLADDGDISVAFYLATVALVLCDQLGQAEAILDSTIEDAQRRGSLIDSRSALCLRGWVHQRQGHLRDAEADARLALDQADALGADILRPWKLAVLAGVLIERDQLDEVAGLLSAERVGPYDFDSILYQPFRDACARLALLQGDTNTALEHLRAEDDWEQRWGVRNTSWTQWRSHAAAAHMARGEKDEARTLAEEEVERAGAFGAPRALGIALRTVGMVEGHDGLERLKQSVEVLGGSEDRLEHARSLFELGAAVRRDGRPAEAREPLRAALDLADRCGAAALAGRAREELKAAGGRPRRERLSGIDALTPQERRVAQLAAGGRTNRGIAESLFLTTRTIEMHLANAYRKLGISTRRDLPQDLR